MAVTGSRMVLRTLLIFNLISAAAFAQNAKDDTKTCNARLTRSVFSEQVLSDHGFDVEQIKFKLKPLNSAEYQKSGTGFDLKMFYQNENHVFAKLEVFQRTADDGKTYATTNFSQIYGGPDWGVDPSLRGKGIGSAIYLIGARLAKELWNVPLMSTLYCSDDATKLWTKFVDQGLAAERSPEELSMSKYAHQTDRKNATFKVFKLDAVDAATEAIFKFFMKKLSTQKSMDQLKAESRG